MRHFESMDPVRYQLTEVKIEMSPRDYHPLGWGGFQVFVKVHDLSNPNVRGLPTLRIDITAPEKLKDGPITSLNPISFIAQEVGDTNSLIGVDQFMLTGVDETQK